MNGPLVSVLMTSFNREPYIAMAVESLLGSAYTNFELIIVDDGSQDKTVAIARQYEQQDSRIKVHVNESNLGDYINRNKAASYATGKYLKYLDSDDAIYRYSLNIMVEAMEANPQAGFAFLNFPNQDDKAPFPIVLSPGQAYYEHFFNSGLFYAGPGGTLIKREVFEAVGGFSGTRMIGDQELWLKLGALHPVVKVQPALIWWRKHEGQEFSFGNKSGLYVKMNYQVAMAALNAPACPLTAELKTAAIATQQRLQSRRILGLFVTGRFALAMEVMRHGNIPVASLLACWVPVNKIKRLLKK